MILAMVPPRRRLQRWIKQHKAQWTRLKVERSRCSVDPAAAPFWTTWFRQKGTLRKNIFFLAWRVVFGNVRFREGVKCSTLLTVTTNTPNDVERVSYRRKKKS